MPSNRCGESVRIVVANRTEHGKRQKGQVFILDRSICFFNLKIFFFSFLFISIYFAKRLHVCDTPDSPIPKCKPISFNFSITDQDAGFFLISSFCSVSY